MIAIDDGIANGNFNAADVFFLIGAILLLIAAILAAPRTTASRASVWHATVGYLGVGCAAFGLFLL